MKGLKKQRRVQIIGLAFVCILGVLAVLWFLPKDAFQFFRSPTEVLAAPPSEDEFFQLGGLVKEGSMTPVEGVQFEAETVTGFDDVVVRRRWRVVEDDHGCLQRDVVSLVML